MADDKFCAGCGGSLSVYEEPGDIQQDPEVQEEDKILSFWAKTKLAVRAAKRADIKQMRPITRVAFAIENSTNSTYVRMVVNVIFFLVGFGIIACLLGIFDRLTKFTQMLTAAAGEGGLSQIYGSAAGSDQATGLLWMVGLLAGLILLFIIIGKALLRAKKVHRKKKREAEEKL